MIVYTIMKTTTMLIVVDHSISSLAIGYWLLAIGYWLLAIYYFWIIPFSIGEISHWKMVSYQVAHIYLYCELFYFILRIALSAFQSSTDKNY